MIFNISICFVLLFEVRLSDCASLASFREGQPFCLLQLLLLIQGHQRKDRVKRERGLLSHITMPSRLYFVPYNQLCRHKNCSHLHFPSFWTSFHPSSFYSWSHSLASALYSAFPLNRAVSLGFLTQNGCPADKWHYLVNIASHAVSLKKTEEDWDRNIGQKQDLIHETLNIRKWTQCSITVTTFIHVFIYC